MSYVVVLKGSLPCRAELYRRFANQIHTLPLQICAIHRWCTAIRFIPRLLHRLAALYRNSASQSLAFARQFHSALCRCLSRQAVALASHCIACLVLALHPRYEANLSLSMRVQGKAKQSARATGTCFSLPSQCGSFQCRHTAGLFYSLLYVSSALPNKALRFVAASSPGSSARVNAEASQGISEPPHSLATLCSCLAYRR